MVDDKDEVLGSVTRGEAHQSNSIKHRSVMIILINEIGELLLQKRSEMKDTFPGLWTVSASGHVSYGESYDEAARRELQEELGLNLQLMPIKKIYINSEREFAYIYYGKLESAVKVNFDKDEIADIRWVKLTTLPDFKIENSLTPAAIAVLDVFHSTIIK